LITKKEKGGIILIGSLVYDVWQEHSHRNKAINRAPVPILHHNLTRFPSRIEGQFKTLDPQYIVYTSYYKSSQFFYQQKPPAQLTSASTVSAAVPFHSPVLLVLPESLRLRPTKPYCKIKHHRHDYCTAWLPLPTPNRFASLLPGNFFGIKIYTLWNQIHFFTQTFFTFSSVAYGL